MLFANVQGEHSTTYSLQWTWRQGGSLDLASLMLGLLCLGQLLLEMDKALLSRRQVSALPDELLLQLGWHVFHHLQITAACLAMQILNWKSCYGIGSAMD